MAEAKPLLLALEKANGQIDKVVTANAKHGFGKRSLLCLPAICSPVAAALAVVASTAPCAEIAASLLDNAVFFKLTSFLKGILSVMDNGTVLLVTTSDEVLSTWELVLQFLHHVGMDCPEFQAPRWLSQLLDAGNQHAVRWMKGCQTAAMPPFVCDSLASLPASCHSTWCEGHHRKPWQQDVEAWISNVGLGDLQF
jgi:hypothetical protein